MSMSRSAISLSKLVAAGALCFVATASPALADEPGYTMNLTAPPTATVGQPIIMQASGSNPPTDFFSSWLDVHAIPTSVLSACPAGYLNSAQVAESASAQGGEIIALGQREQVDAAGNWAMPIAYSPRVAGRFLICAYSNDGATYTFVARSHTLNVAAAHAPSPSAGSGGAPGAGGPGAAPATPAGGGGATTPAVAVGVVRGFKAFRAYTRFSVLRLSRVPSGSNVIATCKYRRKPCPGNARKAFIKRNASGVIALTNFTRVKLKVGSVMTIKVTKPGAIGAVKIITIRRSSAPLTTTRCIRPGSSRVVRC